MQFVITGTGRCGTGYVSQMLLKSGIFCGHEKVFTPTGRVPSGDYVGDSSWCAVPLLDAFEGRVLHLIREPYACIASLMWMPGLMREPFNDWGKWLKQWFPRLDDEPLVVYAARFWVKWNIRCGSNTQKIEEFDVRKWFPEGKNVWVPKNYNRIVHPPLKDSDKDRIYGVIETTARHFNYKA